jgi:hypothetical protein
MFHQIHHRQPLVGGYTQFDAHTRLAFLEEHPILGAFLVDWLPASDEVFALNPSDEARESLRRFLREHHIRWIILHKRAQNPKCEQQAAMRVWSPKRLLFVVAPAVVNGSLKLWWEPDFSCWDWGDWDAGKALEAELLVRRLLGAPAWDDAELVAFRVPWQGLGQTGADAAAPPPGSTQFGYGLL